MDATKVDVLEIRNEPRGRSHLRRTLVELAYHVTICLKYPFVGVIELGERDLECMGLGPIWWERWRLRWELWGQDPGRFEGSAICDAAEPLLALQPRQVLEHGAGRSALSNLRDLPSGAGHASESCVCQVLRSP